LKKGGFFHAVDDLPAFAAESPTQAPVIGKLHLEVMPVKNPPEPCYQPVNHAGHIWVPLCFGSLLTNILFVNDLRGSLYS
jgi:hypothetical protein